jgi:hypothetical protein
LSRHRRLSLATLVAGLIVTVVGLVERPAQGANSHTREIVIVSGLFLTASGGASLLALLGKRDPLVPDERYYNLISSKRNDRG